VSLGSISTIHKLSGYSEATILIASAGATAILMFGAPTLPFSQPRNVVGGHTIAALSGLLAYKALGDTSLTPAIAVASSLFVMQATSTVHPPAGGTALIAAMDAQSLFFVVPVYLGSMTQVGVACIFNNIIPSRRYPQHW